MSSLVAEFARVLEDERNFAVRADVDGLTAIQQEKRLLLDQLLSSGAPAEETQKLREQALANVKLIRHLVVCLAGGCTPPGTTCRTRTSRRFSRT